MKTYLVITHKNVDQNSFRTFLGSLGVEILNDYRNLEKFYLIKADKNQFNKILDDSRTKIVDNDEELEEGEFKTQDLGIIPSNVYNREDNWGLARLDQRQKIELGNPQTYKYNRTGKNVDIYIIDSGIRSTHEDFSGRVKNLYKKDGEEYFHKDDNHGTNVASAAAGKRFGIAKESTIYNCRSIYEHKVKMFAVVDAVEKIIQHHREKIKNRIDRPSIVNISIYKGTKNSWNPLMEELMDNGIVTIVCGGNSGKNIDDEDYDNYPAESPYVIPIFATNENDKLTMFSDYTSGIRLCAPGIYLTLASPDGDNKSSKNKSGTSFSAPMVAGICALICEGSGIGKDKTYFEKVKSILWENVTDVGNAIRIAYSRVDNNIIEEKFPPKPEPEPTPDPEPQPEPTPEPEPEPVPPDKEDEDEDEDDKDDKKKKIIKYSIIGGIALLAISAIVYSIFFN